MPDPPKSLVVQIEKTAVGRAFPRIDTLVREILDRYGTTVQAVLFYGSCLRTGNVLEGLVDLYVIVDGYRSAFGPTLGAVLNRVLPPNVFYAQRSTPKGMVRCKYAVLSMADFRKGTGPGWFHSYLWGRFAQPSALIYARDSRVRTEVLLALSRAVVTFISRVAPCLPAVFSARELWQKGLALSYGAEIRSEPAHRQAGLFDAAPELFEAVTRQAMSALPHTVVVGVAGGNVRYRLALPKRARRAACRAWRVRTLQGKILSVLRLVKATATFDGGPDYIRWKIERHTGVAVDIPPLLKQHPILAMAVLAWRVRRQGGFR